MVGEQSAPGSELPVLDLQALEEGLGNDDELLGIALGAWSSSGPQQLPDLRDAVTTLDRERIARACHRIKGGLVQIGARAASAQAVDLEAAAGSAPQSELESRLSALEAAVARVAQAVAEVLSGRATSGERG